MDLPLRRSPYALASAALGTPSVQAPARPARSRWVYRGAGRPLRFVLAVLCAMAALIAAPTMASVREYRQANEHKILNEFVSLLSIPNVATDTANIRRNAEVIIAMMEKRGLSPRLLEGRDAGVPPVVYGEWKVPGAKRTIILYAHYDGQPTIPANWTASPPWQPTLRTKALEVGGTVVPMPTGGDPIDPEWRLYGRSTADDKLGVMAVLVAIDALKAEKHLPAANIKIVFEGEEEAGSPNLAYILDRNKALLASNGWVIFDGPVHQSGRRQVIFGVRGVTGVDLTVYGARRPLHSGHYGNWSPNPALELARLLASMKDDKGHVLIKDFYDDDVPIGDLERRAIAAAPDVEKVVMADLGIARSEAGDRLLGSYNRTSLNIDGLQSAEVGENARNVIPATATATIDMRLVRGADHAKQVDKLVAHIKTQGFHVTEAEPTDEERARYPGIIRVHRRDGGYNAVRTPMDTPLGMAAVKALGALDSQPAVALPTMGASLPLFTIDQTFAVPLIIVGSANYDNNQHAENENVRIQNFWNAIETAAAIMTMKL